MKTTERTSASDAPRARLSWQALPLPGLEQLWVLMALAWIGVFIALVPTPPHDFWWHLKAGQIIAEQGIPTTNMFSWSMPADTPYVYATWLGEWLFYALYQIGGLQAPVLARNLLGLAGFTLVAVEARRRSGSWRLAALAVLLAWAMASNNLPTRTQNWSWVPFALYALILGAYAARQASPRTLLALPLIMAFWVNAHGAFTLGLGLLMVFAVGETLRWLFKQPEALGWDRLRPLYLASIGTFAATLLNPLGVGIFGYVLKLLTDPPSQGLVIEWQPPTTHGNAGFAFFVSILLLLAAFALSRRRPTITDVLLVGAFLWWAWNGQRYVVWYGMIAMPMLAQSLAALRAPKLRTRRKPRMTLPSTVLALVLLGLLIAVQPPFKASLGLPQQYKGLFADLPGAPELYGSETPVAAAEYLRAHPIAGRLFNEMGYGSYLDWALYPSAQVFVDPRVELYPLATWQDYIAIRDAQSTNTNPCSNIQSSAGDNAADTRKECDYNLRHENADWYNTLLIDKYNVQRVLLDKDIQPKLAAALAADSAHWQLEYSDKRSQIYLRK